MIKKKSRIKKCMGFSIKVTKNRKFALCGSPGILFIRLFKYSDSIFSNQLFMLEANIVFVSWLCNTTCSSLLFANTIVVGF